MKTSTKFALLFLAILLSACSITPKYHSIGYHIEWKHNFKQNEQSSGTKNNIAENTREMYSVDQKAQCPKTQNPEKREIIAPKKLAIAARPATSNQAQQSKYTSYRGVTNYAQTSDTPITYKQLRKLAPLPADGCQVKPCNTHNEFRNIGVFQRFHVQFFSISGWNIRQCLC